MALSSKMLSIRRSLEKQFTSYKSCDEKSECQVETRFQALLKAVDYAPRRIKTMWLTEINISLKLNKDCELIAFQIEASGILQGDHWCI
jgi:hypothetical protein